jgi:hypothetical protein
MTRDFKDWRGASNPRESFQRCSVKVADLVLGTIYLATRDRWSVLACGSNGDVWPVLATDENEAAKDLMLQVGFGQRRPSWTVERG